jgi:hypothetical protein
MSSSAAAPRAATFGESARLLAAGLAAAALVAGAPAAEAKVVLVQPQVKNFVTGYEPEKKDAPAGSSSSKRAGAPRGPPPAASSTEGFDPTPLALPAALAALAAGAAAVTTLDPGFAKMMVEGGAKDSRGFAGYETELKETPFFGVPGGAIPSSLPLNKNTDYRGKPKNAAAPKKK